MLLLESENLGQDHRSISKGSSYFNGFISQIFHFQVTGFVQSLVSRGSDVTVDVTSVR